jgi:opacity protein-like surface antigen
MRILISAALAATLLAGAAMAADAVPPGAEAGLDIARAYARTDKIKFRKVKVAADGVVCGMASVGGDRDTEFLVNPADQTLWLNEGAKDTDFSDFKVFEKVLRGTEREAYQRWKACQKGS